MLLLLEVKSGQVVPVLHLIALYTMCYTGVTNTRRIDSLNLGTSLLDSSIQIKLHDWRKRPNPFTILFYCRIKYNSKYNISPRKDGIERVPYEKLIANSICLINCYCNQY